MLGVEAVADPTPQDNEGSLELVDLTLKDVAHRIYEDIIQ
jgi:hypothetical protein